MHRSGWFIGVSVVMEEPSTLRMYWEWTEIISGWEDVGKLFGVGGFGDGLSSMDN